MIFRLPSLTDFIKFLLDEAFFLLDDHELLLQGLNLSLILLVHLLMCLSGSHVRLGPPWHFELISKVLRFICILGDRSRRCRTAFRRQSTTAAIEEWLSDRLVELLEWSAWRRLLRALCEWDFGWRHVLCLFIRLWREHTEEIAVVSRKTWIRTQVHIWITLCEMCPYWWSSINAFIIPRWCLLVVRSTFIEADGAISRVIDLLFRSPITILNYKTLQLLLGRSLFPRILIRIATRVTIRPLLFRCKSIALQRSVPGCDCFESFVRPLTFITGLAHVLHIIKVVVDHGSVVIGYHDTLSSLEALRPWNLPLLNDAYFSGRIRKILFEICNIQETGRNRDASLRVNTLLKLDHLVVFQWSFSWLIIYREIDDADQLLIFLSHGKELQSAYHYHVVVIASATACTVHQSWNIHWGHRLVIDLISGAPFDFRHVDYDFFIVEISDPVGLVNSLLFRKDRLRVIALAEQLKVNPGRYLHFHLVDC